MAFNAGAVRATLEIGTDKFVSALKAAGRSLRGFKNDTDRGADGVGRFRRALATLRDLMIVLPGIINLVAIPLRALKNGLVAASNAAAEYQQTTRELGVTLALQGSKDVPAATASLQKYAAEIQDTTQFSDGMVLKVAQTLAVLGVQEDQLEEATKATLDYSAATGREAVQSAINFGKTLGGVVGELGEAFPAVKELTQEQLKAGGAFELAAEQLGGFSEAVANTTQGLRAQFTNALGDLAKEVGFAINPVIDQITILATEAVKGISGAVRGGRGELRDAFASLAGGALRGLQGALDFALDFPTLIAQGKAFAAELTASLLTSTERIKITVLDAIVRIQESLLALGEGPLRFLFGADALAGLRVGLEATQQALGDARREIAGTEAGLKAAAEEARKNADAAEANAQAIREGKDQASLLAQIYQRGTEAITKAQDALGNISVSEAEIAVKATSSAKATERRLAALRQITGVSAATEGSAEQTAAATDQAARNTVTLANAAREAAGAFDDTAASAERAASAAGGIGGGGGAGGDAFGRRRGGSLGLVGSTAAETAENLASIQRRLSKVSDPLQQRSGRAIVDQLSATLRGQIQQETSAFATGIIDELNRAGIFDPTQREDIIQSRLDEARRLGIITTSTAGQITGFAGTR